MRLIDTETGEFVNFAELETTPTYAILSHTWDPPPKGEQTYQEVMKIQEKYRDRWGFANLEPILKVFTSFGLRRHAQSTHEYLRSHSIFLGLLPLWWWTLIDLLFRALPSFLRHSIWDFDSGLSEKVRRACEIARGDGYRYIWVDSSCINKDSSSELSEAINSMYNWYCGAHVCYAFLVDVPPHGDVRAPWSKFRQSRWFTRCWTLQELIAPSVVVFLSNNWEAIGTKDVLVDVIQEITSIDRGILTNKRSLGDESVADRMRWAANRKATRVEDEAYSLLGVFGITMSTLYGEGRYAFRRLQEEILQRIPDQSLFAWGSENIPFPLEPYNINLSIKNSLTLLAPSPRSFKLSRNSDRSRTIQTTDDSIESLKLPVQEYSHTPYGIRTQLRLLPLRAFNPKIDIKFHPFSDKSNTWTWYLALFGYQQAGDTQRLLSRLCCLHNDHPNVEVLLVPDYMSMEPVAQPLRKSLARDSLIFTISLDDLMRSKNQLQTKTVYLPHPKPAVTARLPLKGQHNILNLTLPTWVRATLRTRGYMISNFQGPTRDDPNSFSFSVVHTSFHVHIHYRHMTYYPLFKGGGCENVMIQARIWILSSTSNKEAIHGQTHAAIVCSPPYTSITWADKEPWAVTLPARSLDLIADSGEQVTLQLGLYMTALSRYIVHVDVDVALASTGPADVGATSLRTDSTGYSTVFLYALHETFNLILTESVRRTLEMKGYSSHLVPDPRLGGFRAHSLTLSRNADSFAIVVKFFCTLVNTSSDSEQKLVVVARITVESLIPNDEVVQDGPHVAIWWNAHPWDWSLQDRHFVLATPNGQSLTLHLGFDIAWQSEYHLHVNIEPIVSCPQSPELSRPPAKYSCHNDDCYTLAIAHRSVIDLTLPGHVRRALRDQGYQVHFERSDRRNESGNTVCHLLTVSHITAGVTIVIEYSYDLPVIMRCHEQQTDRDLDWPDNDYPFLLAVPHPDSRLSAPVDKVQWKRCQQELIFRAFAWVLPCGSDAALQDDLQTAPATVDWDAKYRYRRLGLRKEVDDWRRHLPNKDITLTLPTGNQLVLRLGFYYVWNGEYCLMVQINPRKPLSRTPSRDEGPPMPDYELDAAGMEYIRRSLAGRTEPAQSEEAHDELLPTDPSTAVVAPEGSKSPVCGQDGDSDGGVNEGGNNGADDEEEPVPFGGSEA